MNHESHWYIQTGVTVRKHSFGVKMGDFLSSMTLKIDGWHLKTIGYLFYTRSKFVHHFIATCEFRLELQSGNTQFGSKLGIFCPEWPWNLMDDLEKHRPPLLYYIKLCAAFPSHWYIKTGVIVWKHVNRVKIGPFWSRMTLQIDKWPWKTIGHLSYAASSFVRYFIAIGEFKLELQSGSVKFRSNSTIFLAVWPWNLTDDLEKQ